MIEDVQNETTNVTNPNPVSYFNVSKLDYRYDLPIQILTPYSRQRLRLKKMFKVKRFHEDKIKTHKKKIFSIKKTIKKKKHVVEVEPKFKLNFTDKNNFNNSPSLEEIKKRLSQKLTNQCALDIKDLKLYHQIQLQQRHNFYFSPVASSESDSSEEEKKPKKDKNGNEVKDEKIDENNPNIGNVGNTNVKVETSVNNKTSNIQNMRIISPFNKLSTCNCKRSKCLKNYCACRINNEMCDETCQCQGCQNYTFFKLPSTSNAN